MSLFRKPKKNLRQRIVDKDEDEADKEERAEGIKINNIESKPKKTEKVEVSLKKKTLLSFEHDLEADDAVEEFQVKKSIQSRRITKKMNQERKQREKEKKPSDVAEPFPEEVTPVVVKLKDDELNKARDSVTILSGREAEMAGYESHSEEEHEDDNRAVHFRQPDPFRRLLERGGIPDAAMIHAARKKRQQARELGGTADFISLAEGQNRVETARLVREDENDKSDEEEGDGTRIEFSVDLEKKNQQQRREAFLAAEQDGSPELGDEVDDEVENWENQQIQKAIRQRQLETVQREAIYEASGPASTFQQVKVTSIVNATVPRTSIPVSVLTSSVPVPNSQELYQKLKKRVDSLDEVHRRHVSNLDALRSELKGCHEAVEQLRSDQPRLGQRFRFFQETRGYVHDLVDCLSTKFGEIDPLEKKWVALLGQRCRELVERRRADVRDEASDCTGAAIAKSGDPDKFRRTAERELRRRKRAEKRRDPDHKDGLSSDDEMDEKQSSEISNDIVQLQQECRTVFSDVVEDFSSLEEITRHFANWRREEMASYRDTYVNLFLPRVLTPFIRLELIQMSWNPLEKGVRLEQMGWYRILLKYGLSRSETAEQLKKDPDNFLLSRVIELAVVPLMTSVVRAAYDPCSASQSSSLQTLISGFVQDYPTVTGSSKAVQQLLGAVKERMEAALEGDVFIPWHFASKNPGFVSRQLWSAAKLVRNILQWRDILSDSILRSLALDQLLKQLIFAMKMISASNPASSLPLDLCWYLAPSLPQQWLGPLAPGSEQLQPLIELIMSVARNADTSATAGRKAVERVAKLLTSLNARAEAQEVLSKYK